MKSTLLAFVVALLAALAVSSGCHSPAQGFPCAAGNAGPGLPFPCQTPTPMPDGTVGTVGTSNWAFGAVAYRGGILNMDIGHFTRSDDACGSGSEVGVCAASTPEVNQWVSLDQDGGGLSTANGTGHSGPNYPYTGNTADISRPEKYYSFFTAHVNQVITWAAGPIATFGAYPVCAGGSLLN